MYLFIDEVGSMLLKVSNASLKTMILSRQMKPMILVIPSANEVNGKTRKAKIKWYVTIFNVKIDPRTLHLVTLIKTNRFVAKHFSRIRFEKEFSYFRHLKISSFSKFSAREPLAKSFCVEKKPLTSCTP